MRRSAQTAGEPPAHYVPSASAYLSAVGSTGLGWGTLSPKGHAVLQAEGSVVGRTRRPSSTKTLYWQRWKL